MGWWQRTLSLANKNITADHPYNVLDKDNVSNQFKTSHDKERNSKNLVRHRVAQALSEIIVISDKSVLELDALGMADFYDIFYEHAFGNYTDILKKVSLHPCMGVYLTHLNNKKSNGNQHPDENYAREIMQLFTIGLNELLENHEEMLQILDNALDEFNSALEEVGLSKNVITFTTSDFGRSLTSNGNGTDHAWGGNSIIMGDAIQGGEIFGEYPNLELNSNLDIGGGVLIPTTATDQLYSNLLQWYGIKKDSIKEILPNLDNFSKGNNLQIIKT
jgi:hypothetical protein